MRLGRTGFVGRFKPLHNGGALALDALCAASDHVRIGVGSANRPLSATNPFTADESAAMLHAYLAPRHDNYRIVHVNDYGHLPQYADGQRWKKETIAAFGSLDWFVTGNPYVRDLFCDTYGIAHPAFLIPHEQRMQLRATDVRKAMAEGGPWERMVPIEVAEYLEREGLVERLCSEFGDEILMTPTATEDAATERARVRTG